jgi:hypothetical protein
MIVIKNIIVRRNEDFEPEMVYVDENGQEIAFRDDEIYSYKDCLMTYSSEKKQFDGIGFSKEVVNTNLLDKALSWYTSGDPGKKAAALDLLPEKVLKKEAEKFKTMKNEEREKEREEELKVVLEKCKKLFPVGTLVWNDDSTDKCVNVIIEEPHIENTDYKAPVGKYEYFDMGNRKTVIARAVRIQYFGNDVIDSDFGHSIVGLEKCLEKGNPIIDLDKFHKDKMDEKNEETRRLKEKITEFQKKLDELNSELCEIESYNPYNLTQEKIQEIVKKYGK